MTLYQGDLQDENQVSFTEKVVQVRRVAKVVKGGRHLTFNAMVVVGDGMGRVGVGLGKGIAVPDAVRKGNTVAKKQLLEVPLKGNTIPHMVRAKFGASRILIKPASPGAGIIAGGAVRAVLEAAGIKDVVAKVLGSRNAINVVKATMEGLKLLQGSLVSKQENAADNFTASGAPSSEGAVPVIEGTPDIPEPDSPAEKENSSSDQEQTVNEEDGQSDGELADLTAVSGEVADGEGVEANASVAESTTPENSENLSEAAPEETGNG